MKKKILSLFVIILLSSVSVYAFDGKGDCPNTLGMCSTTTSCPIPGQEKCVAGYYCDSMDGLADCQYAGFSNLHCERAGGTWDFGLNLCKKAEGIEMLIEGSCAWGFCQSDSRCTDGTDSFNCFEGSYCAETEGQAYCAPPDFSQEHCTTAGGTWDGITETCQVSGPSYNGKGECPNQPGPCNSDTQCPSPGNDNCASGYYCTEEATLWKCGYAGSYAYCAVAGGTWDFGKNVCIKSLGVDIFLEGTCDSCNFGSCINGPEVFNCFEGSYCAETGGQAYCAPPDFSQEHCTTAGGTWDGLLEICNLGVETCSDVIQNQDETDVDCGGICAVRQKCKLGEGCSVDTDCVTNKCFNGLCKAANAGVTPAEKKVMSWFEKQICYKNVNSDFCKKFKELEKQYINENTIKPANEKVPVKPKLTVGDLKPSFFQKLRLTFTGKFWDFNN